MCISVKRIRESILVLIIIHFNKVKTQKAVK